mmetsp:Transcript_695/g.1459  ORF Transcript_695/g.1459 Transcript_695/m.1459 type:complete len:91 (+) Transcript_695:145-417(+)
MNSVNLLIDLEDKGLRNVIFGEETPRAIGSRGRCCVDREHNSHSRNNDEDKRTDNNVNSNIDTQVKTKTTTTATWKPMLQPLRGLQLKLD